MVARTRKRSGGGLLNKIINHLPVELHVPGYQYCGPGTKLSKRLARGDPGINPLDAACKDHDIAYSKSQNNITARNVADKALAEQAWSRVLAKDAGIAEKAVAWGVTNAMKAKSKLGMSLTGIIKMRKQQLQKSKLGVGSKGQMKKRVTKSPLGMGLNKSVAKKPKCGGVGVKQKKKKKTKKKNKQKLLTMKSVIRAARAAMTSGPNAIESALRGARAALDKGVLRKPGPPRVLPVPTKMGGILPFLIPILAGLSATGALAGGAAGIAKAVNEAKAHKHQLSEIRRHNATMEAIALGKGLYLKPYKKGMGLYLRQAKN